MRWFMSGGGFAWLGMIALAWSCNQHSPQSPQAAYQAFYDAVLAGKENEAASWFAPEHLDMFRRVGEQINRLLGEEGNGLKIFFKGARWDVQAPLRKLAILSQDQGQDKNETLLEVSAGDCRPGQPCSVSQVHLRRLAQRWVIVPEIPEIMRGCL